MSEFELDSGIADEHSVKIAKAMTRLRATKHLLQDQLEERVGTELFDIYNFHDKLQRQLAADVRFPFSP